VRTSARRDQTEGAAADVGIRAAELASWSGSGSPIVHSPVCVRLKVKAFVNTASVF
jgi:hypothetical protein